jgi:ABC-2 type transport system ATP-binding protein
MRETIRDLAAQGVTVVVSSHVLSEVARTADVVGVIGGGRMLYQGALDGLTSRGEDLESVFMELVEEQA